ncbi:PREDICTED: T-cell surface antigen CD2 isoform X2 [Calidris pugnax]|uniref:T-cell surface antigen CD2 isoform X2 n=1 Tax=Calidris pugnax TaxID=198806 RepID=UPI00071E0FC9|nr:PREDICTED: T-cell surface antigen CD2 isoform X2 [Calidris pugnax]
MNFRRIFLVECLLLLFPSVKCSITNWIYMAVNETLLLSITAGGSLYEVIWQKNGTKLLQIKGNDVRYYAKKTECRCKIFPNGTLQIQQVVREDSGNYTVTVYRKDGKWEAEEHTRFIVQEPVPQPILSFECRNKNVSAKCEVKQKTKDDLFTIELIQDKIKKIQNNTTKLDMHVRKAGTVRCIAKNRVSEKMAEKAVKCSGQLDLYLILSIAGGAIFFVIFVILLIYCIRKKKAERRADDEERMIRARQLDSEMVVRELPQTPCNPTPKQLRVQQRPLPQPQVQQQPLPPRPRPRTQQRTPNHPKERP